MPAEAIILALEITIAFLAFVLAILKIMVA